MVGTFDEPMNGDAMGIFTSREAAEEFIAGDPFVAQRGRGELDGPAVERGPADRALSAAGIHEPQVTKRTAPVPQGTSMARVGHVGKALRYGRTPMHDLS